MLAHRPSQLGRHLRRIPFSDRNRSILLDIHAGSSYLHLTYRYITSALPRPRRPSHFIFFPYCASSALFLLNKFSSFPHPLPIYLTTEGRHRASQPQPIRSSALYFPQQNQPQFLDIASSITMAAGVSETVTSEKRRQSLSESDTKEAHFENAPVTHLRAERGQAATDV